jgi:hypothetical protein
MKKKTDKNILNRVRKLEDHMPVIDQAIRDAWAGRNFDIAIMKALMEALGYELDNSTEEPKIKKKEVA